MTPDKWKYWRRQGTVKLWEALLISLGHNPRDDYPHVTFGGPKGIPFTAEERVRVVSGVEDGTVPIEQLDTKSIWTSEVVLADFLLWALGEGYVVCHPEKYYDTLPYESPPGQRHPEPQALHDLPAQLSVGKDAPDVRRAPASQEIPSENGGQFTAHESGKRWTEDELRQLLDQRRNGATHEELAKQHGVKRQRISALLQEAEKEFGKKKLGTPFVEQVSALTRPTKKR